MVLVKVMTRTSSKVLDVDDSVIRSYQNDLRSTTRAEAGLLELLNGMFWDIATAPADALDEIVARTRAITAFYRDGAGALVVGHNDGDGPRLSLLWPVRQPAPYRGPGVSIRGSSGNKAAFVVASGTVLPLAAVSADRCDFDWGRTGTGPINFYLALVFAVTGEDAPVPPPEFNDLPESLYGWIMRRPQHQDLTIDWTTLEHLVAADEPLRRAQAEAVGRRRPPG